MRAFLRARGLPAFRATQILRWVYQQGVDSFDAMTDVGHALRAALAEAFAPPAGALAPSEVAHAADDTRKLLFSLERGRAIESVIIPDPPRLTACISSQAGCAMGCAFCATARLGLQRHLTAAEIAGQLFAVRAALRPEERLSNVVFMGMGEPLANYDNVVEAIEILTAPWGFGLSGRRVTVSTVGLLPQLQRLVRETPVSIAVSLTATTDALRDELMPVNRRYPLAELFAVCRALPIAERRRITFEYVLLAGVNDSVADAARLVKLLHGIRSKVNLIPFNPFPGAPFAPPPLAVVDRFKHRLLSAGINASTRVTRGRDIQAACGQLAATHQGLLAAT
ncbi:MAG: 23S rRNA (adenine(2503)-C(2))-methyltransferase RlmN [Deltaproteobacteria bacterium]|nr:23S rRNA (adenine(2503)-C(2))-methyltransferase RlmN [Deltaproteobacteria bacterium]